VNFERAVAQARRSVPNDRRTAGTGAATAAMGHNPEERPIRTLIDIGHAVLGVVACGFALGIVVNRSGKNR